MYKKYLSIALISLSFVFLFYTFYKSEIFWDGTKRDYYLIYYFFSVFLFTFSVITFFLNEKLNKKLFFLCIIFFFIIYSIQGYLFYTKSSDKQLKEKIKIYKKETGKEFDLRNKFEVYKSYIKQKKNVSIVFNSEATQNIKPLSGMSNIETIFCNENGEYAVYNSDRYGFNNPDAEWSKKDIEFLIVGNSFAQGSCVNRPNDIASVLRKLSEKSVLNLGYRYNGPLSEYAILREYLVPNVKKILWLYSEDNDLHILNKELNSSILKQYLTNENFTQNLKDKQNIINNFLNLKIKEKHIVSKRQKLFNFIKLNNIRENLNNYLPKKYKPVPKNLNYNKKFEEILILASNLAKQNDSEFYFIYLPDYKRYKSNYDNANYIKIKKVMKNLNIIFIDLHKDLFQDQINPLDFFPFKMYGHYNTKGYGKIADFIYEVTKKK